MLPALTVAQMQCWILISIVWRQLK